MVTIKRIKKNFGAPICRRCLNEHYHVKLRRSNCFLSKEVDVCPVCEDKKRLVTGFTLIGAIKLLWK